MANQTVKIKEAKGRPMLTWVGKRPLRQVTAFPAQKIETFDPTGEAGTREGGLLLHGDNKEALAWLLANGYRGKVKLIYIDPPFDSGADYVRQVKLRGVKGISSFASEDYSLGEQIQYTDIWANDTYLQFMYERLALLKELLADDGSIYLHCDAKRSYLLRCLLDELFGAENFRNEVIREKQRGGKHHVKKSLGSIHDTVFHYSAGDSFIWNEFRKEVPDRVLFERYPHEDEIGRYALADCTNFKVSRPNLTYDFLGFYRTWKWTKEEMLRKYEEGEVIQAAEGNVPRRKVRPSEDGDLIQSLWYDVPDTRTETDYPTEKSSKLLERIIELSSDANDIVLDCFVGSGTTAAVAQKLGRQWIACDINKGAIQTTSKRLQSVILEQMQAPPSLPLESGADAPPPPAQLSFSVYRINDYDLQLQRNEAVQLAMEHVGITPSTADPFFEGTRGKQLAKVIPFERPLTLLDLEGIKQELANRPEETRGVVVVCLGKEMAVDGWLEGWNRWRKAENVPNAIEVIELRTDPRYGKFFVHTPASARVRVTRAGEKVQVVIEDFISPTIIERLKSEAGLLAPQIEDWRAMVDSVMIDTSYNGQVFNIALADIPEKKDDLVRGVYELEMPAGETTVAVKVTDMLGEEVLEVTVV